MSWLQALLLGIVQGLTEFLPVSSSGHLVIGQHLLGFAEPHLLFDVAVHVGTLAAVVVVFAGDLRRMLLALLPGRDPDGRGRRLILLLIVGSVPAAVIGLLLHDLFELLYGSVLAVGVALLVTGAVLLLTVRAPAGLRDESRTSFGAALLIGVAQACAIVPGISRSGSTIGVGLLLGLEREFAARFSFLLSLPAIAGALVLELRNAGGVPPGDGVALAVGGLSAAVVGYAALRVLVALVRQGRLHWFAYYCWGLGVLTIVWSVW